MRTGKPALEAFQSHIAKRIKCSYILIPDCIHCRLIYIRSQRICRVCRPEVSFSGLGAYREGPQILPSGIILSK